SALAGAPPDELVAEAVRLVADGLGAAHVTVLPRGVIGALESGMTAGVSAVIPGPDRPFGALQVAAARATGFSVEDVRFLEAVARVLGAALASRRADDRFRAYLESAPDAIVVVDREGRIVLVNPMLERLFGYAPGELVGQAVEALLPAARRQGHVGDRTRYLGEATTRPMGSGRELEALRKDGTSFPVDVSLTPLPGHDGVLVAAAVRDMTARAELEEERRRLHETRLLRRQSLEINDNVIQGLTTAAYALELGETSMARAAVNHTLRSARRMISGLLGAADGPPLRAGELRRGRPARVLPPRASAATGPEPRGGGEAALRVVIADDVVEIRHLLRQVLTPRRGFAVVGEAADGQGAIELTETLRPDALLLDLAMPAMDGLAAIPRIRQISPETKICVLTGYPSADGGERAAELGAHAYLEKGQATAHIADVLHQLCLEAPG
ncbi:MAG: PAS domain S-box protein, partial [Actinomycetota bacterium]|nr:PAS domain S-box protein [Actinomycetota bacterium]